MNRPELELHAVADRVFFDRLDRLDDEQDRFPIAGEPLPAGWRCADAGLWVIMRPALELPEQGWKIHVSATAVDAEKVIGIVAGYCFRQGVAFKFLRSRSAVTLLNGKAAPRAASGKVLAVYPADADELTRTLAGLAAALPGVDGPYVLSDLRYTGPLYVRYGAFEARLCAGPDGRATPALRAPDGTLVPDPRRPAFTPPPWVTVPEPVRAVQPAAGGDELPYRVLSVLGYSNSGGVYLAEPPGAEPERVVLREARPHAGLDRLGRDAVERLSAAERAQRQLAGLSCVPKVLDRFRVWEHEFLVEEYLPGRPLAVEILERHPLSHPRASAADRARYADWLAAVLDRVAAALAEVHDRGLVWDDAHPGNVLVDTDGSVALIDFEAAGSPDDGGGAGALGAPGFGAPPHISGTARDLHALDRIALFAVAPHAVNMSVLAPAKVAGVVHRAEADLPLAASVRERLRRCRPADVPPDPAEDLFAEPDWPRLRDALVAGILSTATPDRSDRLFPGDPEQFRDGGAALAYGAAGVLHALNAVTEVPPELVDWLVRAALTAPAGPIGGLFHGPLGVAAVLDQLGRHDEAVELRTTALDTVPAGPGVATGVAGAVLAALAATGRADSDRCLDTALRLAEESAAAEPVGRIGLLHGMSGIALMHLRLYERTGDVRWLDRAERALRHDVDRLVPHANGAVYAPVGTKNIAHLAAGSGGVGLVLHALLRHRPDPARSALLDRILHGLTADYVLEAGLFEGRAGLLTVLYGCRAPAADIAAHIRGLSAQAVTHRGHLLMAGRLSRRLSADLATGSAGVLMALHCAHGGGSPLLPGLFPATSTNERG
ncbi:class III lanthionine synthetase LanKC [Actinoplanes sp. NPDC026670]|uniref:class III lanthionine synthetase LanKC n=1 Tax=Actinoplanes sp. NPDC026670 TaxID=3154700 RepID=UPI0033CDC6BE